jgi:two-component system sensor histidine kinase CpxA
MKSLFAKIFACVWLSHILASILIYALLTATRPEPPAARSEDRREEHPPREAGRPPDRRRGGRGGRGDDHHEGRGAPPYFEIVRFGAIFVAANVAAYGLALYLTGPITKLRRATHQLATGDLSTRVASQMGKRRDELADLGHDFDVMAERMENLLQSERRLLGDISHELRSPLARMQVALDLAGQSADEETRGFLERIERESARLNDLIGQLLTLTRLETAATETRRQSVDLAQLVAEVAGDADFEARGQNREVRVTNSEECAALGHAELLRRAIENVARNAVRYTGEGTTVEIALRRERASTPASGSSNEKAHSPRADGEQAVISVRDHGPGVPEAALEKLFDPFYRVGDARDRQSGGVGLGLSIAARAAAFHGGSIAAFNAPGGGLLIEIRLPIVKAGVLGLGGESA